MFESTARGNDPFNRRDLQLLLRNEKGGGASRAINSGGVLSIRMNNLGGMLIGIPSLGQRSRDKVLLEDVSLFLLRSCGSVSVWWTLRMAASVEERVALQEPGESRTWCYSWKLHSAR